MLDINKHKTILLQILKEIYTDISLGPVLGFKGGTAAYLFYKLNRFSVDLDLDLLDESKEEFIFKNIEKIISDFGNIKEKYKKKYTLFYLLSYLRGSNNIKIEINTRNFGSKYELKNYLGVPMLVMIQKDMFAHKLAALLDRKKPANRDIFDIWYFLKNNWDINEELVKIRTGLKLKEYLKKCINHIEEVNDRQILNGIGELLDEKTKDLVRKKLKSDTIFLLKLRLEDL